MSRRSLGRASTLEPESAICEAGAMSPVTQNAAVKSLNEIATVRITLRNADPAIWREVEVPTSSTLKVLNDIIQGVMGWFDYHLWEFTIGERRFGLPMDEDWGTEPRREAGKVRLRDVLKQGETVIDNLYDFGDGWEHRLVVTDVRPGDAGVSYPRYVGGEGNGPPEDCGGIPGFHEMLDAISDPGHPDHAEIKEWAEDYDPQVIDELSIKYALSRIANRRNAAKARLAKKVGPVH